MKHKVIQRPFEVKKIDEDGTFEGYGSVFGAVDAYRDIVLPGAFANSLAEHEEKGTMPALLWQHNPTEPVGVWLEMREDDHGLFARGQLALNTQRGSEARELLLMKALRGLSIGYSIPKGGIKYDEETDTSELSEIKLWETSLVTFPANAEATVTEVRSKLDGGTYPTEREFERFLTRDAGFTRSDAQKIISNGFAALVTRDADDVDIAKLHAIADRILKGESRDE